MQNRGQLPRAAARSFEVHRCGAKRAQTERPAAGSHAAHPSAGCPPSPPTFPGPHRGTSRARARPVLRPALCGRRELASACDGRRRRRRWYWQRLRRGAFPHLESVGQTSRADGHIKSGKQVFVFADEGCMQRADDVPLPASGTVTVWVAVQPHRSVELLAGRSRNLVGGMRVQVRCARVPRQPPGSLTSLSSHVPRSPRAAGRRGRHPPRGAHCQIHSHRWPCHRQSLTVAPPDRERRGCP